jgi:hypothetical protein
MKVNESSIGSVAHASDEALFRQRVGEITRRRLMQRHARGEI